MSYFVSGKGMCPHQKVFETKCVEETIRDLSVIGRSFLLLKVAMYNKLKPKEVGGV